MPRALLFTLSHQTVQILDADDTLRMPREYAPFQIIGDENRVAAVLRDVRLPVYRLRSVDSSLFRGTPLAAEIRNNGNYCEVLYAVDPHVEMLLTTHIREELDAAKAETYRHQHARDRLEREKNDFWSMPWYRRVWTALTKRT